ncbi:hypothetical protein LCGC14_2040320 [marine sediment metagenome]|uniref:Uncharacterized protein n=1 Tax=marine sediment metagenome TaxID=412755 RepID=A0A0F9ERZ7_9ZZZZ
MRIREPEEQINLVRAGSIPEEKAFKEQDGTYFIRLNTQHRYFKLSVRPEVGIDYNPIWIFNVRTCTLGIFDEDKMVEPVELEVHVIANE